jgi:hypothetical protein
MKKLVAYKETLTCTNKSLIKNLGTWVLYVVYRAYLQVN